MKDPLKQGLKPIRRPTSIPPDFIVEVKDPLKQGLKQNLLKKS